MGFLPFLLGTCISLSGSVRVFPARDMICLVHLVFLVPKTVPDTEGVNLYLLSKWSRYYVDSFWKMSWWPFIYVSIHQSIFESHCMSDPGNKLFIWSQGLGHVLFFREIGMDHTHKWTNIIKYMNILYNMVMEIKRMHWDREWALW